MDELTKLAIKYGTDKWGKHHYTPFYYEMFKNVRGSIEKVVEMGVGEGASLRMWRDFFPRAQIYGGEVDPKRVFKENRIEVFKCDQTNWVDLSSLCGKTGLDIDIFIDDGSHKVADQLFTCTKMLSWLDKDVQYLIEDVADPGLETLLNEFNEYDCQMFKFGKRYDDRIITVKNKWNFYLNN